MTIFLKLFWYKLNGILLKKEKVSTLEIAFIAELSNLILPLLFIKSIRVTRPFLFIVILRSHTSPSWIFCGLIQADWIDWIIKLLYSLIKILSDFSCANSSSLIKLLISVSGITGVNSILFSAWLTWTC